jgi:hypothetical protein
MQLETVHFPSDLDSSMGALSRELCKALHMASEHPDHAETLDSFLKFSTKQLRVAKDDYKTRKALLAKRETHRAIAAAAKRRVVLQAKSVKVDAQIKELTAEQHGLKSQIEED